ncbi:uncharacterized protein EDB91DRAFT_1087346 [Suillus paluster]|uniref:uncharacterized protein n=1 Tax=Suillus paluster TaxID=48578 RepID=UPI001B86E771|nr:uncharacterized protein EDB91DRAFT_1087346 [Suillus paluster]KAG1724746.1 hypothetical protein EDB91DRAFT_1087346 [Suillus paluster]
MHNEPEWGPMSEPCLIGNKGVTEGLSFSSCTALLMQVQALDFRGQRGDSVEVNSDMLGIRPQKRGPSQYDDKKGMKFTILFTPLQPLDPKCRKNAKLTTTTEIVYVHEDMSMKDMITKVQDVRKVEVALKLLKQKVITGDNPTKDKQDEEDNENPQKKQKQCVPSTEEIAQGQHVVNLQNKYHCEDRACPYDICYPSGPTAKHEANTVGVDIEHPPNSKIFNPTNHDNDEDDITALAQRRHAQLAGQDHNNQSNITVNFAGLAKLI